MEAVQCGVEIQQAMAARNTELAEERKMLLRIGTNVGDVMVKDEDIFGDGVNVAARPQGLAVAGGICISRAVSDLLRDKSPFVFEGQGEQAVKNIARPVRVFTVRFEGAPKGAGAIGIDPPLGTEMVPIATADDATDGQADATELAFWDSITDSAAASDYVAYLERYPTGNAVGSGDEVKLEITYWESVKDSDDTAMIRSYLEKYPDGHFKELAEARLDQLKREKKGEERSR